MIAPKGPRLGQMLRYVGRPFVIAGLVGCRSRLRLSRFALGMARLKELPLALYGSAIGVIVGFRNNSAYSRWWEARTLWGQIVNNSRSFGRQVCTTVRPAAEQETSRLNSL